MKYIVIAEGTRERRGDKRGDIFLAGAGGDLTACRNGVELTKAIEKTETGTRGSVIAKAKSWIRFPCRMAVEIDDDGKWKILRRHGRGSVWFMEALGLPSEPAHAAE